jgi:hypothetical protein
LKLPAGRCVGQFGLSPAPQHAATMQSEHEVSQPPAFAATTGSPGGAVEGRGAGRHAFWGTVRPALAELGVTVDARRASVATPSRGPPHSSLARRDSTSAGRMGRRS